MNLVLGMVGMLAILAGLAGMLMLPALAGIQAGMIMICGAVLVAAVHVVDHIDAHTKLLREVTRPDG